MHCESWSVTTSPAYTSCILSNSPRYCHSHCQTTVHKSATTVRQELHPRKHDSVRPFNRLRILRLVATKTRTVLRTWIMVGSCRTLLETAVLHGRPRRPSRVFLRSCLLCHCALSMGSNCKVTSRARGYGLKISRRVIKRTELITPTGFERNTLQVNLNAPARSILRVLLHSTHTLPFLSYRVSCTIILDYLYVGVGARFWSNSWIYYYLLQQQQIWD